MAYWCESSIDRQMREATERGEFDNLPGLGKPLADHGEEYDDDWWVKDWLRREGAAAGVIPPTLALRREVEDLAASVDRLATEAEVRDGWQRSTSGSVRRTSACWTVRQWCCGPRTPIASSPTGASVVPAEPASVAEFQVGHEDAVTFSGSAVCVSQRTKFS
jgi:DnaJ-like protein